jgi:GTP diphosphokinase / guanosine-3',5'-bis(diphosphate) 3'-diphosphatase
MFEELETINSESAELAAKELWSILHNHISYLTQEDQAIIELAFTQMVMSHGDVRRKSGIFYIIHPVAATILLAGLHIQKETLAACLLHDVPEDTTTTIQDLSKDFSAEIIFLIDGVTKFSTVKYKGEERYAENLRKMFIAMSKDIRVIFIKLADRIHNLSTLSALREDKQFRIALESLEIYAPIAERLGMSRFRGIIEDFAFPYVYPVDYSQFVSDSVLEITQRELILSDILTTTTQFLKNDGVKVEQIVGRAKRYYSIYKKLQEKGTLSKVYDLIAIRIICSTIDDCYKVLSMLQRHFDSVPGRLKDYIVHPKENGYQSIHNTVFFPDHKSEFEFQIRTIEMDEYAEFGVATHWAYKQKTTISTEAATQNANQLKWISDLVNLGTKEISSEEEYLKHVKINLYEDRIFVLTPKGDAMDLRTGSTALDFAFKIHEHVGKHAVMAKINGKPAKLEEVLQSGDMVEIETSKNQFPKQDWLQKVTTPQALGHIKNYLSKAD